jgi:uncharacterized membrane protein
VGGLHGGGFVNTEPDTLALRRGYVVWSQVVQLVACCACVALVVWTFLTEPVLSAALWPADIHANVVRWLGGSVQPRFTGPDNVILSFGSVAVRMVAFVAILCAVRWLVEWNGRRSVARSAIEGIPSRRSFAFLFGVRRQLIPSGVTAFAWLTAWFVASFFPNSAVFRLVVQTGAFALAVIGALFVIGFVYRAPTGKGGGFKSGRYSQPAWIVGLTAALWIAVSFWMNERLYAGLWIPHGDSAMYEEHLWNIWHGKGFRSYLDQGLFLGEHLQFIHVLLLPFHMIWPSHLLLELAESTALGICVIPLYRMTHRATGSSLSAMWICLAWLCFVPMHFLDIAIDFKTLRPICYGLPFLFFAIDLAEQRRLRSAAICLLFALAAKEDYALVVAPLGLSLAVEFTRSGGRADRRGVRWAVGVSVLSATYLLLAVFVLIPWFRDGQPVHYSRYFGDLGSSPGDLVRTVLTDPLKVVSRILSLQTFAVAVAFLVPLAGLPLRCPIRLAAGIPSFLMLCLLQFDAAAPGADGGPAAQSFPAVPYHHFHAPLLPILFWAAAGGLKRVTSHERLDGQVPGLFASPAAKASVVFAVSALLAVFTSMMPIGAGFWSATSPFGYAARFVPGDRAKQFERIALLLPPSARIASTDYVHTRLTHCDRSYDYSDYLRAVNDYEPGVPADTDLIVIDTRHPWSQIRKVEDVPELQQHPDQWRVWPDQTDGYFIVLERRKPD